MTDVIYKIQGPDGMVFKIQGPEGASEADLQGAAQAHYATMTKPKVNMDDFPRYKEEKGNSFRQVTPGAQGMMTALSGLQGAIEPFAGAAQWLGINKPAEALKKNREYAEEIAGTPATVANFVGNLASPLPIKGGALAQKAMNAAPGMLAKSALAHGAAQGVVQGATTPTDTAPDAGYGEFLSDKAKQLGMSGGFGAVVGKGAQMLGAPQVSEKLQMLKDMGMKSFTPGQLMGQFPVVGESLKKMEQAATSIPLVGQIVGKGMKSSFEDFNRALGNKVLEPLGIKVPKDVPAGSEMISYVKDKISNSYDQLLQNATFRDYVHPRTGINTVERLETLMNKVSNNLVPKQRETFQRDVVDNVIEHIDQAKILTGSQFRNLEKYLGEESNKFYQNGQTALGEAYSSMQNMLRNELTRQNPTVGKQLRNTHEAFRNLEPIEKASNMVGATAQEGVFSPSQFLSSAKGKDQFKPAAVAGVNVLGNTMPSSGTAERLMTAGALGTAGTAAQGSDNPYIRAAGLPLALSALAYNKPAMNVLTKIATSRPDVVRQATPAVAGLAARGAGLSAAQPTEQPMTDAMGNPLQ